MSAALAIGTALAIGGTQAQGAIGGTPQITSAPRFLLTAGGTSWSFSELASVNLEVEPNEFIFTNFHGVIIHAKQYGKTEPASVTLKNSVNNDMRLWKWHLTVQAGNQKARHDVLLTADNATPSSPKAKAFTWELIGAWPSKIEVSGTKAGSAASGVLTVTFRAEAIEPAPSGEPVIPVSQAGAIQSGKAALPAVAPPATPHGTPSALNAVSCASATACTAVGRELSGGTNRPLVEQWNGTNWASTTAPMPAGASGAILSGISCPTATACVAVGESHNASGVHTLAEAWNGSTWTVQSTQDVAGAPRTVLTGVSCTTATSCIAVGTAGGSKSHFAISEVWNGAAWQHQPVPKPTAQGPFATGLTGVSCSSARSCTAVGANGTAPLAATWDGTSWTLQAPALPSGASSAMLRAVACTGAGSCMAVGSTTSASGTAPLAESTTGSSWSIQGVPTPTGTRAPILRSVTCFAANSCAAAGSIINRRYGLKLLLERWNGTAWAKVPSPDPADESRATFTGVSCAKTCAAVGVADKPNLTAVMQMLFTSRG